MSLSAPEVEAMDSGTYMLSRDWSSSARLSFQHWILKLREGWLIHPKVKNAITSQTTSGTSPSLRIADVAAGNCIWSMEVLSELPNAEITAFDLSTETFPRELACPPNLHLETWDIFDPIPEKFHNYFDMVHVRLVVGVLHKHGHEAFTENLVRMLKPGGWIQWQDALAPCLGPIDSKTLEPVPESDWPMPVKVFGDLTGVWEGTTWIQELDQLLRDVGGCEETELYRVPVKRETLKYETDGAPWLYHELLRGQMKTMMNTEEGEKRRAEIAEAMEKEVELIAKGQRFWAYSVVVAVGRRPGGV